METRFVHDDARGHFVAIADAGEATLTYARVDAHTVDFQSTWVPHALRHRRLATQLTLHALAWARANGQRVIPSCWCVRMLMDRQPEWADVRAG